MCIFESSNHVQSLALKTIISALYVERALNEADMRIESCWYRQMHIAEVFRCTADYIWSVIESQSPISISLVCLSTERGKRDLLNYDV